MALFNTANAREMAARSVARRQQLVLYRQEQAVDKPLPADAETRQTATDTLEIIRTITGRLRRRPQMASDKLDELTRSLERLWKIHAHAAQIPQPAHIKPERRRRDTAIDLEPVPMVALPDAEPGSHAQPAAADQPPGEAPPSAADLRAMLTQP